MSEGVQVRAHRTLHKLSSRGKGPVLPGPSPAGRGARAGCRGWPSSVSGHVDSLRFWPRGNGSPDSECGTSTQWLCPPAPCPWSIQLPDPLKGPQSGLAFPAGAGAGDRGQGCELRTSPLRNMPRLSAGPSVRAVRGGAGGGRRFICGLGGGRLEERETKEGPTL